MMVDMDPSTLEWMRVAAQQVADAWADPDAEMDAVCGLERRWRRYLKYRDVLALCALAARGLQCLASDAHPYEETTP